MLNPASAGIRHLGSRASSCSLLRDDLNVRRLRPLLALRHLELDLRPFGQRLEAAPGISVWWTNRSVPPESGVMKPYPLSLLNHLTVPVAMRSAYSFLDGFIGAGGARLRVRREFKPENSLNERRKAWRSPADFSGADDRYY